LPTGIVKKIQKFAQFSGIKCGSIDMIVTPNDEYYFLEVNSVGQFQWLSKGCNYFIERHIAQYYGQI
jgi:D-alanine-D-alanine ligase-like ATP-grasp enzyme